MKPSPIKIPTFLGLLIIIILGILLGVTLIYSKRIYNFLSPVIDIPQHVRITNISNNSFVVSWITKNPTNGHILYGKKSTIDNTTYKSIKNSNPTFVHFMKIEGLDKQTAYNFQIGLPPFLILQREFGNYTVQTSAEVSSTEADLIYGSVIDSTNKPVKDALVYITIEGIQSLSALTNDKGEWSVNLGQALSTNLDRKANYDTQKSIVEIFIQDGKEFSNAISILSTSKPVPVIKLGHSYDFTKLLSPSFKTPKSSLILPISEATESSNSSVDKSR